MMGGMGLGFRSRGGWLYVEIWWFEGREGLGGGFVRGALVAYLIDDLRGVMVNGL